MKLGVRLMNDDGSRDQSSRLLDTISVSYTAIENGAAQLTFDVSRATFTPSQFPFVVRAEYHTGDGWNPVSEHDLFIVEGDSDDSKDAAKVASYTGQPFLVWLLQGSLIHWSSNSKDGKRKWLEPSNKPSSAGYTLTGMITESKNAGWMPALQRDFNGTTDSNGKTWQAAEKDIIEWPMLKHLSDVLSQLTDTGMCDWSTEGTTLRLFRPGTMGRDRTELVLGGPKFDRVPVKTDASNVYTHLRAVPEDLPWQNHSWNTSIKNRFGHRSMILTQSGIETVDGSNRDAAAHIATATSPLREESYEWTPAKGDLLPWTDIRIGDTVVALSRGGRLQRRVIGIIASQTDGAATVQVRVGDLIGPASAKLRKKLGSIIVGGSVGGSGDGFPSSLGPSGAAPDRPDGLMVSSNVAHWSENHTAVARVTFSWAAVTHATDGSEIDITEYELWSKLPGGTLTHVTTVNDTTAMVDVFEPGVARLVAVRARSAGGRFSEFSLETSVTPVVPADVKPKAPVGLMVSSNTASWGADGKAVSDVKFTWSPVTQTPDGVPINVAGYELWGRLPSGVLAFVTAVTGTSVTVSSLRPGVVQLVAVRAQADNRNFSDFSTELSVTPAQPASVVPKVPTGLAASSNVGSFTAAGPIAKVTLTANPVTESTDGSPITIAEYEWWIDDVPSLRTPTPSVTVELPSGKSAGFKVLARTTLGTVSDLSAAVNVTGANPALVSRAPSTPTLKTGAGNAFATWDGAYTVGGFGSLRVDVEARVGTSGSFTVLGSMTSAGEQIVTLGAVGDTVEVRLRAYDQLGRLTGTSSTASIVVEGIDFESFDDLVQDRFLSSDETVARLEQGQIVIGRTVDGLNRTFTSITSPGRGFLGYDNLAPSIKGSGSWAEVRRNYTPSPSMEGSTTGWATTGAVATITPTAEGIQVDIHTQNSGGALLFHSTNLNVAAEGERWSSSMEIEVPAGFPAITIALRTYSYGQNSSVSESGNVTIQPGETMTVESPSFTNVTAATTGLRSIVYAAGTTPAGARFIARNSMLEKAITPGVYFDGSMADFSVDPDMRQRWVGAENASASVMQGQIPTGVAGSALRCVAILSEKGGLPAVRLITTNTTPGTSSFVVLSNPINSDFTALVTLHQDGPIEGTTWHYRGWPYIVNPTTVLSPRAPNEAGSTRQRARLTGTASGPGVLFPHGGVLGDPDVYYTSPGIYAGDLPEDAVPFHNGDLWHRLDYRDGQLTIVEILIWDGQDWVKHEIWADSVFAANSVTTRVLNAEEIHSNQAWLDEVFAGVISVDMLQPLFGENLNLSANGQIRAIAGDLGKQQTHFIIDPALGVRIKPNEAENSAELRLEPNRIGFWQAGKELAYMSGTVLGIDQADIEAAGIASHSFERYGTNRTIIRPR